MIGTFASRTAPYCNVLTLTVTQNGDVFGLSGYDEPCGGRPRLPVQGIAVPQTDGTVTLGLTVMSLPGGAPVNLEASIELATVSGTWRDGGGLSGPFAFGAGGASAIPRPLQVAAAPCWTGGTRRADRVHWTAWIGWAARTVVRTQWDRVLLRGVSGDQTIYPWHNRVSKEIETAYPYQ